MRPEACARFDPHPCGSDQAYQAGCRRDSCRLMQIVWTKTKGQPMTATPQTSSVRRPAEPYARVVRELIRQGWTIREIARRADYTAPAIRNLALGQTSWIYRDLQMALDLMIAQLPSESKAQLA